MTKHELLFRTDILRAELPRHSVRSGAVAVAARGTQIALQLGSLMVLGRLLTPEDFGVQAMVLPVAILVNSIVNLGLQTAVIHREQLDDLATSAMFWFAIRVNLAITALMALSAPFLARLYSEPRVVGVTLLWAAIIYCATFSAFHEALLKRQMRFATLVKVQLGALLVSVLVGVLAALLGAGYWALMIQIVVVELTRATTMWVVCPWRPALPAIRHREGEGLQELRIYWASLSGTRAIAWVGDQLDRVMVGATGGAPVLGLYHNAKRWAWLPFLELFLPLSDVAVSSLSRMQHEPEQYRAHFRKGLLPILTLSLPAIAFIFVESRAVLHLLLGDQWLEAAGFVRLMCIAAIGGSVSRLMQWIYLSTGQTRRQLRWTFFSTAIMLPAVIIGARWGAFGVATGFAVATCALALPSAAYALHKSPFGFGDFARVFARPLLAALVSAAVLFLVESYLPGRPFSMVALFSRLSVFAATYGLAWLAQPGGVQALRELLIVAQELRTQRGAPVMMKALTVENAPSV